MFEDLQDVLASPGSKAHEVSDSIIEAYKRAFQSSKVCQDTRVILRSIGHGNHGYRVVRVDDICESPDKAPEDAYMDATPVECYLESLTFRKCAAIPLNAKELPITIQGINNRRCALEGARVMVRVFKDSDRCGRICEVVEQGPQQQFVCGVDNHNAIYFSPIDSKSPRLVNLPGLSREIFKHASEEFVIEEELKYKQRVVTIFDPKSFHIPSKGDGKINIPQIKDVIPLSIAQKLLFVVWYLRWRPKYRYPLGVVVAAIPKGLTLYHGERLLLAYHHINTAPVDDLDDGVDLVVPSTKSSLPHYDHAFTIDPPEAQAFDDALTLEPVASDDGKCYQLGVHITNVGGAVKKGSGVHVGGLERATAVYGSKFSPKYYPLLSERVRNSLSLNCNKETATISFTCQVCVDGKKVIITPDTISIHESCVQSRANLTYDEAQYLLTEMKDSSLDRKVTGYNKVLSTNSTFGLKQRLSLLLQISESFFRNRMQFDDMHYSIEDVDELSSPQAYFLVKQLMVWANRIAAEHILTAFPQLALLRRQKSPNQDQLEKAFQKCKDIVAHSPVHKRLADTMKITTEPGPVVIMETMRRKLYDSLQHGDLIQAKNLLRIINYHPQLAVLCKEVNTTKCRAEYVCSSVLQKQKPLSLGNNSYLVTLPQDGNEVYGHNDLHCLYTHSTSPLRRYIDIVVQRLILQSLSPIACTGYSAEEIKEICRNCNTKMVNASKFERDYNCLSIALSLSKCSQTCTVHVTSAEKTLNFVIQELDYHCLLTNQFTLNLSSIARNAKPWDFISARGPRESSEPEGCKTFVWKVMITSFSGELGIDHSFANATYCKSTAGLTKDAMLTFYIDNTEHESVTANRSAVIKEKGTLIQHSYMVQFGNMSTSLGIADWRKVTDFMKLPSPNTAAPLKDMLSYCNTTNHMDALFPQILPSSCMKQNGYLRFMKVSRFPLQQPIVTTSCHLVSSCLR